MDRKLIDRVRNCPRLPTLPAVAVRVLELTQGSEFDMAALARVLSKDPALSSGILRTVNSSFYGNAHPVGTISQALVMLGSQAARMLAVSLSLAGEAMQLKTTAFDRTVYWRRAIYAATAARLICQQVRCGDQEACSLAALLMDVGMLALDQVLGEEYGATTSRVGSHADLAAVEARSLGLTHAQVSGFLGGLWKFPPALRTPMEHHHQPREVGDGATRRLTEVVALAGRCADVFVDENPIWAIGDVRRMGAELFQMDESTCDRLLGEVGERTRELAPLFKVKIDPKTSYGAVTRRARAHLERISRQPIEPCSRPERRSTARIEKNGEMLILPCRDGVVHRSTRVSLIDISARGIGFTCDKPMRKGDQFVFQSKRVDGTPMSLLYRATRCCHDATKGYLTGAELVCVLNNNKIPASPRPVKGVAAIA